MKPGSWLEISEYDSVKAGKIFSQGFVQLFILKETLNLQPPAFPFMVLVQNLAEIKISAWKKSALFKGFMWRTDSAISESEVSQMQDELWIDYIIKDPKKSEATLKILPSLPTKGFFVSADESVSLRKLNNLLNKTKIESLARPHDIIDSKYHNWEDLEIFEKPIIEKNQNPKPEVSVIIPHYESPHFLCNVLKHLQDEFKTSPPFEVIVVDDGSSGEAFNQISYFAQRHLSILPVRIFMWKENHTLSTGEKLFRAGASRNWGATAAKAKNLFFLDSDMLVPTNIIGEVLKSLEHSDVIQFVRKHIPFHLSSETTSYKELFNSSELYIEESNYWKNLFECKAWSDLLDFWKYTCTYALALKTETFFAVGRIRRNYIQYGFEDTDLGYRLFKSQYEFQLNTSPLLHLTAKPDRSQNYLFKFQKMNRIRFMARTFYKLNLDPSIYKKFQSLLD